jgi:hypothetical protein
MRISVGIVLAAAALVSAACSTYRQDYVFDPAMRVSSEARPRVFSTVVGVLRGDSEFPAGVEVRVRLEAGEQTAEMVREELQLVTADLIPLDLVRVEPEGGMIAPATGAGTWRLIYAYPAGHDLGSLDLTGLVFTWKYRVGESAQSASDTFRRMPDPYWLAPYPYYWHSGYWYGGPFRRW